MSNKNSNIEHILYKKELKRVVVPLSDFLSLDDTIQEVNELNFHEKVLYMGIMVKEFLIENLLTNQIALKLYQIDSVNFHLELVNDNEDCYNSLQESKLTKKFNILTEEFNKLTEDLTLFEVSMIIDQYIKDNWR